ncbi:MAG: hypothetical protein WBU92_03430 [Candidatus Dormiibacterota bacterium]
MGQALARELLAAAWLPSGSVSLGSDEIGPLAHPESTFPPSDLIDLHLRYSVPIPEVAFQRAVTRHPPPGTALVMSGTSSAPGLPDVSSLYFSPRRLPVFAEDAQLAYAFYSGSVGITRVRLDSEVVWRPDRTAATLVPWGSQRVAIRAVVTTQPSKLRPGRVVLGPGSALRRLIRTVNSEPAMAPGLVGCALVTEEITASFYPSPQLSQPSAVVTLDVGCAGYSLRTRTGAILLQSSPSVGELTRLLRVPGLD